MIRKLERTLNEKDVENVYREEILSNTKGAVITSPFNTDGLMEAKNVRTLLEFKYNTSLKSKLTQCGVLIQCLYYIKKFEQAGEKLPSTIFVGDKNECFALHTNDVVKYLSEDIDWTITPSNASKENASLLKAMVDDTNILPFVYDVDENFSIKEVLFKIKELSENIVRKILVTKNNISTVYNYFDENVLGKTDLNTNQKANLFIQIIINPQNNFLNPNKHNELITESNGSVSVNSRQFKSFFKHFDGEDYSPKQKEELTGVIDRLVEDTVRRNKGEFYTPTAFVDLAHDYISDVYGDDWKERFVVWDCAWGTGNLTRDYRFKELYASTLEQSDIDTANQMGYNPGATKFQFDFLNDPDSNLPQGLQDAINSGKEILFLINPPYATANNMNKNNDHKGGLSNTVLGEEMRRTKKWGSSTQQIYSQFFYRIWKYQQTSGNIHIGVFCKPNYLQSGSFDKFRKEFLGSFNFKRGFLFQASHFSDVSAEWGINFAIFDNNDNKVNGFEHDIIDISKETFELESRGSEYFYNTDFKNRASDWVRQEIKGLKTYDAPQQSSTYIIKEKGRGSITTDSLGYFLNASNNVYYNSQSVGFFSSCFSNGNGLSVIKENLTKCTALFTARKTIKGNWINDKDEYLAPTEEHELYEQFSNDSLVYSLFNNSSQQSSLRQVDYKDKKWDIKNEFFWLSKEEVMELANKERNNEIFQDAKYSNERYMYKVLQSKQGQLSQQALHILELANELYVECFKYHDLMHQEHPEYHLNTWDAGYAQLKLVWQKFSPEKFKEFRDVYNSWSEELVPMVYELGFLKE